MKIKQRIPHQLWEIALRQDGVIGHAQVTAFGLTRNVIQRALDDRLWWQVIRGVYAFSPQPSWRGLAWAGLLLGGDGAVLGHEAAGHLYGWVPAPSIIDVLVPRRAKARGCWVFHQTAAPGRGTPRTTLPERTALDLCSTRDERQSLGILADAITSRLTTAERLLDAARARPNLPRRRMIVEVLGDVAGGVHSHLEQRFQTFVEQAHGLTGLQRQMRVSPGEYTDVIFEEFGLIVELDGRLGHDGRHAFRDRRRDNRNARSGWATLRYGWDDVVADPCGVLREIVEVLRARGWRGDVRRCPRCPGR